jgi:hypothetical protein
LKLEERPPLRPAGMYGLMRAFFSYSFLYLFDLSFDLSKFIA